MQANWVLLSNHSSKIEEGQSNKSIQIAQCAILLYMTGLLIDTSQKIGILALLDEEEVITIKSLPSGPALSSSLHTTLLSLFSEQGLTLRDLSYIAAGLGPGSYIGMRTGGLVAKTLSYALGIPLHSLPSPLFYLPSELEGPFTFVGDAKMGQQFFLTGSVAGGRLTSYTNPRLLSLEESPPLSGTLITDGEPPHLSSVVALLARSSGSHYNHLPLLYLR